MWSTREALEDALKQGGLEDWAPRLAAAARHTMILEPGTEDEGPQAPIGASRLGGMPDLPTDVPWPWRPAVSPLSGRTAAFEAHAVHPWPLSFVAQVDFAEVQRAGGLEGFPTSGRLLFFCDPINLPIGESTEDQACARVMFISEPENRLARRAFPVEFNNPRHELVRTSDLISKPRRLSPRLWLLPPPFCSRELRTIDGRAPPQGWSGIYPKVWDASTFEAYERFWDDLGTKYPNAFGLHSPIVHQVGGIPFAMQDPVEVDCVKYADDDYRGQPEVKAWFGYPPYQRSAPDTPEHEARWQALRAFDDARRPTWFQRADRWQLVLQIDGDGVGRLECERLYVCIRKEDLAARRFERCWTQMQCT